MFIQCDRLFVPVAVQQSLGVHKPALQLKLCAPRKDAMIFPHVIQEAYRARQLARAGDGETGSFQGDIAQPILGDDPNPSTSFAPNPGPHSPPELILS